MASKIRAFKDPLLKKLGDAIRKRREHLGMDKETFIRETELSKYYYYRLEYGNANPSILQLKKIAEGLKCKVKELIDF
jgi:transcriptional regulator with XRE-family HTH domain